MTVLFTLTGSILSVHATEAVTAPVLPVITSFEALPAATAAQVYENKPELTEVTAAFPATLSVTLDSAETASSLPVTWVCSEDYANTSAASYLFTPVWDTAAYTLSPSLNAAEEVPHITVMVNAVYASVTLVSPDKAAAELDTLAKTKNILALVYLCDSYDVKKEPGSSAETLLTVNSGQSVQITGVTTDSLRNIWYQTTMDISGTSYTGYVERDFLAYSDEELINFEHRHINSFLFRSAEPAGADPYQDVNQFPASYQTSLKALKDAHPNWTFVKMDTELVWSDAVKNENTKEKSLISSRVNAAWKTGAYDNSWAFPSDGILSYYMDPRNFLTDSAVFQFELLSFNATYHTQAIVQSMLDTTFMNGLIPDDSRTYSEAFYAIGQPLNVSPFHLAARVRVEQGAGTSPLISGKYSGYEGVYNYFNIGASGQGTQAITSGLTYARGKNWNTRYLSLEGGARILSQNYISKGQDSLYLQKFNVNKYSASGVYEHQYMQNIVAPSTESSIVNKAYTNAGVINKPFVFKIPVYDSMPGSACAKPAELNEITMDKTAVTLKADATTTLTAFINGTQTPPANVTFQSTNAAVASVDSNGTVTALTPGTANITCTRSGGTTATCTVTVEKTDPPYTVPALNSIVYDPAVTLASVTLPSGWAWDNPSTIPTVAVSGYPATYTPADTAKYNTVQKSLSLAITKGTPSYTGLLPENLQTAAGNTLASLKLPAGFSWDNPTAVLSTVGAVTETASYNPDAANYNTVTGITISITVNKKAETCTTHTFGEWEHVTDAGCTTAGSDTHSCHICGYKEARELPASGHVYTAVVTKQPTETETGIRTYTCTKCGDSYTESIDRLPPSHKHSYTAAVTKEASCTEKGIKTYTCSCGDSYTEDISPLGHTYTAAVTKQPTETEDGIRTYTCSRCKTSYTETIAKLPAAHKHSYTSAVTKQPSCTEKGTKTYTCSCGDSYTEDIAAPGHNMVNGKCTRCGYTESSGSSSGSSSGTSGTGNQAAAPAAPAAPAAGTGETASSGTQTPANSTAGTSSKKKPTGDESKTTTVNMKENTVLYEETLSSIRGKDVEVVLNMGNNVSWTINGSNIVYDEANGVDMGVTLDSGNIPEPLLKKLSADDKNTIIELTLAHDGSLDFKPVLTINTAKENAGRTASLFYFNPDTQGLDYRDAVKVAENGDISFVFNHASDYAVVISDEPMDTSSVTGETTAAEEDTVVVDGKSSEEEITAGNEESGKFSTTVIVIVVIIFILVAVIGITIYLISGKKDKNEYADEETITNDRPASCTAPNENKKKDNYLDDGKNSYVDDYHEPAISKKTGKITSLSKTEAAGKSSGKKDSSFDDDEFDGFE